MRRVAITSSINTTAWDLFYFGLCNYQDCNLILRIVLVEGHDDDTPPPLFVNLLLRHHIMSMTLSWHSTETGLRNEKGGVVLSMVWYCSLYMHMLLEVLQLLWDAQDLVVGTSLSLDCLKLMCYDSHFFVWKSYAPPTTGSIFLLEQISISHQPNNDIERWFSFDSYENNWCT
jgi:hypothetical protein